MVQSDTGDYITKMHYNVSIDTLKPTPAVIVSYLKRQKIINAKVTLSKWPCLSEHSRSKTLKFNMFLTTNISIHTLKSNKYNGQK